MLISAVVANSTSDTLFAGPRISLSCAPKEFVFESTLSKEVCVCFAPGGVSVKTFVFDELLLWSVL